MPTLDLTLWPPALRPDDPVDGPGCHAVTRAQKGRSQGWARKCTPAGEKSPLLEPGRVVEDYRRLGAGVRLKVYQELEEGLYEADTALEDGRARRATFLVEAGEIRWIAGEAAKAGEFGERQEGLAFGGGGR